MFSIKWLFVANVFLHTLIGAAALSAILLYYKIRTTWQHTLLITLGVIVSMHIFSKLLEYTHLDASFKLFLLTCGTLLAARTALTRLYSLKEKTLVVTTLLWTGSLLIATILLTLVDVLLLKFL